MNETDPCTCLLCPLSVQDQNWDQETWIARVNGTPSEVSRYPSVGRIGLMVSVACLCQEGQPCLQMLKAHHR